MELLPTDFAYPASTSFPVYATARRFGVPYGVALNYADALRHWGHDFTSAEDAAFRVIAPVAELRGFHDELFAGLKAAGVL